MIKLTKKELDVLAAVAQHVTTDEQPFFTTSNDDLIIQRLAEEELVDTREKDGELEVAILESGAEVLKNRADYEIADEEPAKAEKSQQPPIFAHVKEFTIDSNIPLPTNQRPRKNASPPFPVEKLEVGQSFFVPAAEGETDLERVRKNMSTRVSQIKHRLGLKNRKYYVGIEVPENGVRVWRKR